MLPPVELTLLLLVRNEAENLKLLLPRSIATLESLRSSFEVVVIDGASTDDSVGVAQGFGCRVIPQQGRGYGDAFRLGIRASRGRMILAIDADMSHPPDYIQSLLEMSPGNDLVVASRYVHGGGFEMPRHRALLSKVLSFITHNLFRLPIKDCSSGFRLYRSDFFRNIQLHADNFDVLIEVLVRGAQEGARLAEVPFCYMNREAGISKARVFQFIPGYLRTLTRLLCTPPGREVLKEDDLVTSGSLDESPWTQATEPKNSHLSGSHVPL